jgi:[ribosomal protein S5]-alanine N-acetyltransferase
MAGCRDLRGEPGVGFVTERLEVRRLVMTDLTDFNEVWGDPRVIFWGATDDLDATRQRLQDFVSRKLAGIAESGWFAVLRRDDGQFVGDVVLEPASWSEDVPEIGWHFAKEWQGRGYATEAAAGLLQVAHHQGIPAVYAKILRTNDSSQGVARRIGMAVVGSLEDHPAGPHDIWAKYFGDPRDR